MSAGGGSSGDSGAASGTRVAGSTAVGDAFGLGCAPIGNLYRPLADDDAVATVERALERGIRFFDTAPHYGAGASEQRLGRAIAGVDRDAVVIATKVGRRVVDADGAAVPVGGIGTDTVADLSRDGILRSLEGSLRRLGTDRVDLLHLHDPHHDVDGALRTAVPALVELRDQGVVRSIGVGIGWSAPLARFVREAPVDVVMIAGRMTLIDRTAEDELLPDAIRHGVGVIAAGVFNSGVLADPVGAPYFDYKPASDEQVERALRLQRACAAYGVALPHAAARFPLRREPVEAVVVGARTPAEVDDFVDGASVEIPDALWQELERG
ncbi:aldo/keto reductase [Agromyces sp. CFH 90414]|uniref:Aldo/keto reductase n=1 Tax=Agromyces agglutinans TaxID=2662258 RepID=A0A6I2FHG1_9MICO|nr:aldo/keto reductase [Agromyces agglutinans]